MIPMITRSLQILIVDDAHFILDRLASLINEYTPDSSIRSAINAEQALALVTASLPDIVILDINLPDFSGIEVLKKIREKNKVKPVIIMLTNNTISDYRLACLELGANYFLDKSKDFLMLTSVIEEVLKLKYVD